MMLKFNHTNHINYLITEENLGEIAEHHNDSFYTITFLGDD